MGREEEIENRKKMLIFRSWHRGTREMDLLLGSFADAHVPTLDEAGLNDFEQLLTNPDPDLYEWTSGRTMPPDEENTPVLQAFIKHEYHHPK